VALCGCCWRGLDVFLAHVKLILQAQQAHRVIFTYCTSLCVLHI
jgi:hypothetical protein